MRVLGTLFLASLVGLLLSAGCGGGGANYADRNGVAAAQGEWCKALAKVHGEQPDKWQHTADCKAAYPTASAAYLRGMTKCFPKRVADLGEKAPDNSVLINECNEEVAVAMTADEAQYGELISARCKRAERCEKTTIAECKSAISHLETAQRVLLTSLYNAEALHHIADCLESSSCSDNEDAAREHCYQPQAQNLLWFPG